MPPEEGAGDDRGESNTDGEISQGVTRNTFIASDATGTEQFPFGDPIESQALLNCGNS